MTKRPIYITIISWIFIAFGVVAFLAGLARLVNSAAPGAGKPPLEVWLIPAIRILPAICGAFMLYGFNWARWLLVIWVGYHVILSIPHTPQELLVHSLLFVIVLYYLFRPEASKYFRSARSVG